MTDNQSHSNPAATAPTDQSPSHRPHGRRSNRTGRRRFIKTAGALTFAGLLAGCLTGGNDGTESNGKEDPASVDDWLSDTGNYEAVKDLTDKDSITVEVGAEGNNGANAFAPAAIKVSPGVTVTWKWVNGYHNVVAEDGLFNSGDPEEQASYKYTFDAAGTTLYYCDPHKSAGMKGAVIVEESGNSEASTSNSSE